MSQKFRRWVFVGECNRDITTQGDFYRFVSNIRINVSVLAEVQVKAVSHELFRYYSVEKGQVIAVPRIPGEVKGIEEAR